MARFGKAKGDISSLVSSLHGVTILLACVLQSHSNWNLVRHCKLRRAFHHVYLLRDDAIQPSGTMLRPPFCAIYYNRPNFTDGSWPRHHSQQYVLRFFRSKLSNLSFQQSPRLVNVFLLLHFISSHLREPVLFSKSQLGKSGRRGEAHFTALRAHVAQERQ